MAETGLYITCDWKRGPLFGSTWWKPQTALTEALLLAYCWESADQWSQRLISPRKILQVECDHARQRYKTDFQTGYARVLKQEHTLTCRGNVVS